MTRQLLVAILPFALIVLVGCEFGQVRSGSNMPSNQESQEQRHTIAAGGRSRTYVVHTPEGYTGDESVALVLMLHGGGGNAENFMRMTGMNTKADEEGFIVVYPEGTGRLRNKLLTWNAGNCCGYALRRNVDDVEFIRTLIAHLQSEFKIDPRRIYLAGFSNGAMMAHRLACELSSTLAAIAVVSGALNYENCQPTDPLSVMIVNGTADDHVLYEGGVPKKSIGGTERVDKSVAETVAVWLTYNQCSTSPERKQNGNIISESYRGCRQAAEVVLYTIEGGKHAWPGGQKGAYFADEPTQEISATDIIWDFFARHPKSFPLEDDLDGAHSQPDDKVTN